MKQFRYGLKFSKLAPLHFIGHLDLMRLWERAWRRANLPVVYSEGFNPHPKMSLAQPLAVGLESEAEYLEFYLKVSLAPEAIKKSLSAVLPAGINLEKCFLIPEKLANLTVLTDTLIYEAEFDIAAGDDEVGTIKNNIAEFLGGRREVKITLQRHSQNKDFSLNPHEYIFSCSGGRPLIVTLKIKYREGVPMHAGEIFKAVCLTPPEKIIRKEIFLKFNFK
jgi:radical SAM-linked protein